MADAPTFGTLDVADFTVGGMLRAGIAIRKAVRGAESLEAAADVIVHYLHEQCVDAATGQRTTALVRFYKTQPYGTLDPELREFADGQLAGHPPHGDMSCLVLMATAGDRPSWNSRHESRAHRAIPLPSVEQLRAAPMILRLIEDLGVDAESVVTRSEPASRTRDARTYGVFHVEDALGSPYIPAQRDFVVPERIASVVGFGGLLRTGELFAVIIFSRVRIPAASASRFRAIALDIRSALFSFDDSTTWRR